MASASLNESMSLMDTMRELYSSSDDADKIRELRRVRGELAAAFAERELYMSELIREMTHRVSSAEAKLALPEPAQQHSARVAELEGAVASAAAELERLSTSQAQLTEERKKVDEQKAAFKAQKDEADAAARATEAELRRHLQLYRILTSLTWDHSAPGRVKGHVVDAVAEDVRPFDFDPAMGRVELADALWAQIHNATQISTV